MPGPDSSRKSEPCDLPTADRVTIALAVDVTRMGNGGQYDAMMTTPGCDDHIRAVEARQSGAGRRAVRS